MFGAVSAHKYIIAFCIGVELIAAGTKRWLSIVYVFTYSFMSALGIAIGILMVGGAGATEAGIYSVVLQVRARKVKYFRSTFLISNKLLVNELFSSILMFVSCAFSLLINETGFSF